MPHHRTPEQRFWAFVVKQSDGCWRWTGNSVSRFSEYGRMSLGGRLRLAHHVSWLLFRGPIPDGLVVRHQCPGGGNPWCVNPDHLAVGTRKENSRDMMDQGRHWSQTGSWSPKRRTLPPEITSESRALTVVLPRRAYRLLTARAKAEGRSVQEVAAALLIAAV